MFFWKLVRQLKKLQCTFDALTSKYILTQEDKYASFQEFSD